VVNALDWANDVRVRDSNGNGYVDPEARPGYPAVRQGIDFLRGPIVADVTGDGGAEYVGGEDSNACTHTDRWGAWRTASPSGTPGGRSSRRSPGDLLSDGHVDQVNVTLEGYLFVWRTPGTNGGNAQCWRWYSVARPRHLVRFDDGRRLRIAGSARAGSVQAIAVPDGVRTVEVQAVGPTGLLGPPVVLR
jgi:hypothetical protein